MHLAKDTEFYLAKGFRVVAVEARPDFVSQCTERLARHISEGRLEIVPMAISSHAGSVSFTIFEGKDDWGTIDQKHAERNVSRGYKSTEFTVPSTTLTHLLVRYRVLYYLKIDIEGADMLCLRQLSGVAEKPKFISIEAPVDDFQECVSAIRSLVSCGYKRFKVVNQQLHYKHRCPNPPLEGNYVDAKFDTFMSGPFGEEAPGRWTTAEGATRKLRRLARAEKLVGNEGIAPWARIPLNEVRSLFRLDPSAWYDIHAGQ